MYIFYYYSFKIFSRFWLVKTTRIIHPNQLLNCHIEPMMSKLCQKCRNFSYGTVILIKLLTEVVLCCFGCLSKMVELSGRTLYSFDGKILSKNVTWSGRSQLDGQYLLFGVAIFADLSRPLSAKFPEKDALSIWT